MVFGFGKRWNPDGKHVYITGGSSGLGLSLAQLLVSKGAHVSIVARNQENLDKALVELEKLRQTPAQILQAQSHSLNSASGALKALEGVCEAFGGTAPDAVFTCAGSSKPMFFLEMSEEELSSGMDNAYWVQAWTAWACAKKMAKEKKTGGKIVLVSSVLGYISFVGYASYSPGKFALRGLADTLHSELMLYGIDVHIFFPPTMPTPGYATEQLTRPEIVKKIEETDEGLTPEQAAVALLEGVQRGDAHITGDLIASLFRASSRGAAWRSNRGLGVGVGWVLDGVLDFVAYIATPIWRASVDSKVLAHRREHEEYLQKKGFFS